MATINSILNEIQKLNSEEDLQKIIDFCEKYIYVIELGEVGKLGMKIFNIIPQANSLLMRRYVYDDKTKSFTISDDDLLNTEIKNLYSNDILVNQFINKDPRARILWDSLQKIYDDTQLEKDLQEIDIDSDIVDVYMILDPVLGPYIEYTEGEEIDTLDNKA